MIKIVLGKDLEENRIEKIDKENKKW